MTTHRVDPTLPDGQLCRSCEHVGRKTPARHILQEATSLFAGDDPAGDPDPRGRLRLFVCCAHFKKMMGDEGVPCQSEDLLERVAAPR